jgi:C-terminal processing protease CtpA/Prc
MISRTAIFILVIMFLPIVSAVADDEQDTAVPDSVRIERLAGLCELWGVIKYFHPYLAYKDIDWDEALIKTIPRVNKAETADDYKQAIRYMLSFLQDPNTYIHDDSYIFPRSKISDLPDVEFWPSIVATEDSIAIIVANEFEKISVDAFEIDDQAAYIYGEVRNGSGVIIDVRRLDQLDSIDDRGTSIGSLHYFLQSLISQLIRKPAVIPSNRYRSYNADINSIFSEYETGYSYRDTYFVEGKRDNPDSLPIVFIINEGSADLLTLLGGLQASKQAAIIYEGNFDREGGIETYDVHLLDEIKVSVRLTEIVKSDGTESVHPDLVIPYTTDTTLMDCPPVKTALDIIRGRREVPPPIGVFLSPVALRPFDEIYDKLSYMTKELRLLALFRFWNELRYFYPYPEAVGDSWSATLLEVLPVFELARTEKEFVLAFGRLIHRLYDSNVYIGWYHNSEHFGRYNASFAVDFIEGKTIISFIEGYAYNSIPGLDVGDIVLAIDGEDINVRRERLAGYRSASTTGAMQRKVQEILLTSTNPSPLKITVQKKDGRINDILSERRFGEPPYPDWLSNFYEKGGYRYIDLNSVSKYKVDIQDSLKVILDSPGMILDLRGPWRDVIEGYYWRLIKYFAKNEAVGGHIRAIERRSPDPKKYSWSIRDNKVHPDDKHHFNGRVVALIDASTIGDFERYCLHLKAAAEVTFIGTPTNGSPSSVRYITMPGGIDFAISYTDVRHSDGRPIHGIGIQPDILVEPTIEGIREGRDEILEAAIEFLENSLDD